MADEELKSRFVGRNPGKTIISLIVASIFVGAFLALLGLSPIGFWRGVFDGLRDVISAIGESFGEIVVNLVTYLILGAAIVVPIWFVVRLLGGRK